MADFIECSCNSSRHGFSYIHSGTHEESSLESHIDKDLFSIFILLDGEIDYIVDGTQLNIKEKDLLLVGNNELHRRVLRENTTCEYILLMVNLDFFIKNNCTDFSDVVFKRVLGSSNIIPAEKVVESGLFEVIQRLDRYAREEPANLTVVCSVMIELFYHLNRLVTKSNRNDFKYETIKEIIEYINEHLSEELSLDDIAKHFYLSVEYLCRLFKRNTGFTVNQYIVYKRVMLTKEFYLKGIPLMRACEKAGFGDYSTFYRAYKKIMNESPRKSLS